MSSDTEQLAMRKIIDALKKFRVAVDEANIKLFRAVRRVELEEKSVWSLFYSSVDALIEDNHLGKPARYRNFVAAEEALSPGVIDKIGIYAALEAMKVKDVERQKKYIEAAALRFVEAGVFWGEEAARDMRDSIAGKAPTDSRYNKKVDRESQLHAENIELKREIQRLKREICERDEEIASLQSKLKKKAA